MLLWAVPLPAVSVDTCVFDPSHDEFIETCAPVTAPAWFAIIQGVELVYHESVARSPCECEASSGVVSACVLAHPVCHNHANSVSEEFCPTMTVPFRFGTLKVVLQSQIPKGVSLAVCVHD